MGFYGANLWDLWGSMFLLSGAYGIYNVLCDCGVGPMGLPWGYGTAVWDLWDCGVGPMGLPWIYGIAVRALWDAWGLWDCSVAPLEFLCAYGIAV